jgi:twitching motility protein PilJ
LAEDNAFKQFLENSSNTNLLDHIIYELQVEMNMRQLEFATLVGKDSRILAGANANRTGEVFDPKGIVSDVLKNARKIIVNTEMANIEFRKEQAKRWLNPFHGDDSVEGDLKSSLHPYDNNDTVIVQWVASPVFAISNSNSSSPDGVLVFGYILNGKINYNDMIVSEFDDGYSGTFHYDSEKENFNLLSAVRLSSGKVVLDEMLPDALNAVKRAASTKSSSLLEGSYAGDSLEFSAKSFETSTYFSCDGDQIPLLENEWNPPLYQVRATSNEHWVAQRKKQLAIQIVTVLVQVISSVVTTWMLFMPVHRFVKIMQKEFGKLTDKKERTGGRLKTVLGKFSLASSTRGATSQVKDSENIVSVNTSA